MSRGLLALLAGMLCAAVLAGAPAAAQTAEDGRRALGDVERELEAARKAQAEFRAAADLLRQEIAALRAQSIDSAKTAQNRESEITELEGRLGELDVTLAERRAALGRERDRMAGLAGALQRIALHPPEALIVMPGRPEDVLRGAILLQASLPAIDERAEALREELASLARVQADILARREQLSGATRSLAAERDRLAGLIDRKQALMGQTEAERKAAEERAQRLSREATDLRDLIERLSRASFAVEPPLTKPGLPAAAEPAVATPSPAPVAAAAPVRVATIAPRLAKPEGLRPFKGARGQIVQPARGEVVRRFGEDSGAAGAARGITIGTRPSAQVVAPYDGQVAFAGPFRSYGLILIIEHDGSYHTLVSGLARIDAVAGQWVLAGEPVGVMADGGSGGELYVELRQGGQPVDPLPWLARGAG